MPHDTALSYKCFLWKSTALFNMVKKGNNMSFHRNIHNDFNMICKCVLL